MAPMSSLFFTVLLVLILTQLTLLVIALTILIRTPEERITFQKKWVWALIIILANTIGPIIFLVAGRQPQALSDPLLSANFANAPTATATPRNPSMVQPPHDSPATGNTAPDSTDNTNNTGSTER